MNHLLSDSQFKNSSISHRQSALNTNDKSQRDGKMEVLKSVEALSSKEKRKSLSNISSWNDTIGGRSVSKPSQSHRDNSQSIGAGLVSDDKNSETKSVSKMGSDEKKKESDPSLANATSKLKKAKRKRRRLIKVNRKKDLDEIFNSPNVSFGTSFHFEKDK